MQNYIHFSFLCLFKVIISTGIVIEVDILERVDTDPPDTPTLDSALTTMQDRINMGQFSVSSSALIYIPSPYVCVHPCVYLCAVQEFALMKAVVHAAIQILPLQL